MQWIFVPGTDAILSRCDSEYTVNSICPSGGGVVYKAFAGQKYGRPPKREEVPRARERHIPAPQLRPHYLGTASLRAGMS